MKPTDKVIYAHPGTIEDVEFLALPKRVREAFRQAEWDYNMDGYSTRPLEAYQFGDDTLVIQIEVRVEFPDRVRVTRYLAVAEPGRDQIASQIIVDSTDEVR